MGLPCQSHMLERHGGVAVPAYPNGPKSPLIATAWARDLSDTTLAATTRFGWDRGSARIGVRRGGGGAETDADWARRGGPRRGTMAWVLMVAAGLLEVGFAVSVNQIAGFS